MKATQRAPRPGPEPLARQHHARSAHERHARALHRRALGDRAHLEPDDLRPARSRRARPTTRRSARSSAAGKSGEALFFELALEDLTRAADLFRPIHERDRRRRRLGVARGVAAPRLRHREHARRGQGPRTPGRAGRTSSSRSPGRRRASPRSRRRSSPACPINVTLLFSREQYVAAAEAYLRGIERRIAAGLRARRRLGRLALRQPLGRGGRGQGARPSSANQLGIAIAKRTYTAYRALLDSPRWQRVVQRRRPPAAPALGQHGHQGPQGLRRPLRQGARRAVHREHDARGDAPGARRPRRDRRRSCRPTAATARRCSRASRRPASTSTRSAAQLQDEGAKSFVKSWNELMAVIDSKSAALAKAS